MAKIDLYDPKWVEMVFAGKNKEYGAYQLRKGTSGRNIKALLILVIAAALVGGFLA
ncbi:MAG: energy transducer TonB, partial [Segatella copri]|nr:energy transducer TonB [Segatella copri]